MTRLLFSWAIILALTFSFTSCRGQIKKDLSKENKSEVISTGVALLISTQSTNEGDNLYCSLQDKAGNLWFGTTTDGVYKYDGQSFHQFTTADELCSNTVWSILEDKAGNIWFATDAGACFYDGYTFSKVGFHSSSKNNFSPPISQAAPFLNEPEVFSIMQDRNGNLWFATIDGVYVYDGISFTPFVVDEDGIGYKNLGKNNVEYILEENAGNIWLGGRNNKGVFYYDGISIINLKLTTLNGHNWAWPVLEDKNGDIWFNNWGGAYRYNDHSFTSYTKKDGLISDVVTRIVEDQSGNIWFGCGGKDSGVCHYDGASFTCFSSNEGLPNQGVSTILEDKAGNIWIGTRNMGLYQYDGATFNRFSENSLLPALDK